MTTISEPKPAAGRVIPRVKGLPFLGNALDARRDVAALAVNAYHEYGPVFIFRRFSREATVLAGPKAVEFYAEHHDTHFYAGDVYHNLSREGGTAHNFNALDGPAHRHLRKEMKPGFSRQIVAPMVPELVAYVQETARSWVPGQKLDAMIAVSNLLMKQAGITLLNQSLEEEDFAAFNTYCKTLVGVGAGIQAEIFLKMPSYKRSKEQFVATMSEVYDYHGQVPPGEERHHDLIDVARQATYEDGLPLSKADALGNSYYPYVMNAIYTNRTISYMLYEILRKPELWVRIMAEVDAVLASGDLGLTSLRRMSVLRAAYREALRMYPLFFAVPRHAKQDFEFEGYHIEAGSKVYVAASVNHFLPEIFPDPYEFDVDRFFPPRNEHRQKHAMAPFGLGAHYCMGSNLTEIFMLTTMIGLLSTVDFALPSPDYIVKKIADPLPGPQGFKLTVVGPRRHSQSELQEEPLADEDLVLLLPGLEMDRDLRDRLIAQVQRRRYGPGEIILRQGDPAEEFYILLNGHVDVFHQDQGAQQQKIDRLSGGDFFGEIGLLYGVPRTATVRVDEQAPAEMLVMDHDTFADFVIQSDLTAGEIAAIIKQRMINMNLARALPALSTQELGQVSSHFQTLDFGAGEVIIHQGAEADMFYILVAGRVEVVHESPNGPVTLEWLEPGEFFGEIGLLQDRPRTATVRAAEDEGVTVLALNCQAFKELVKNSEATELNVAREMAHNLIGLAKVQAG